MKITEYYIWEQNMSPTEPEFIGSAGGLNNSHTYPTNCSEPTTEWHFKAWYSTDSLGLYQFSHTVDINHISLIPVPL